MTSSITPLAPPGAPAPTDHGSGSLAPHKRRPPSGPAFVLPGFACFACADTGIVSNHDGAINEFIPDYDLLPSGEILPGSDPAIICCCFSAYPANGRGGYRDSAGPRRLETAAGPRAIGCELDQQAVAAIHRQRRQVALASVQATADHARRIRAAKEAVAGLLSLPAGDP
jgi:hypothetical protein